MSNFWKSLAKINKTLNYLPVTHKKTFICCDHWTTFYAMQKPDKHNHKPSVGFSQQSLQLKELTDWIDKFAIDVTKDNPTRELRAKDFNNIFLSSCCWVQ